MYGSQRCRTYAWYPRGMMVMIMVTMMISMIIIIIIIRERARDNKIPARA